MSEPTGLRRLLEQATPEAERDWESFWMCEAEAKVVALAPEMAALLCDIVEWMARRYPEAAADPDRVCSPPAVLLSRFRALDDKAGQP